MKIAWETAESGLGNRLSIDRHGVLLSDSGEIPDSDLGSDLRLIAL